MLPKNISIILHLYQPSIQSAAIFKQIYETSYQPLLKILKANKNAKFTLNMPLSFLELMDSYGYGNWISDIAKLYEAEKIELTGSAAYHPLLSRVTEKIQEDQIVLNEYGLGYYFGKKTGFEGEKSILLKNVSGFFAPELAVNADVLSLISGLGYTWAIVDDCTVGNSDSSIVKHSALTLIVRNTKLSNTIAFYRGYDTSSIVADLGKIDQKNVILAFDGETFGHHNKDGILFLDSFLDAAAIKGHSFVTVKELLQSVDANQLKEVSEIKDSSWGATLEQISNDNPLPFWDDKKNELQVSIWEIIKHVMTNYAELKEPKTDTHNLENLPIWKNEAIQSMEDAELQKYLMIKLSYSRLVASDFTWWASNYTLYNGAEVYDPDIVRKFLELATTVANMTNDEKLISLVQKTHNHL